MALSWMKTGAGAWQATLPDGRDVTASIRVAEETERDLVLRCSAGLANGSLRVPEWGYTVMKDALADGRLTKAGVLSELKDQAEARITRLLSPEADFSDLPSVPA